MSGMHSHSNINTQLKDDILLVVIYWTLYSNGQKLCILAIKTYKRVLLFRMCLIRRISYHSLGLIYSTKDQTMSPRIIHS